MRWILVFVAALISAPANAQTLAIVNARVWTGDSAAPIENANIIMRNGKIIAIGPSHAVPDDAQIIDAAGRNVTPALNAAATQIGLVELGSASDSDDRSVSSGPLGAAFDVALAVDANALTVQEARAQGVAGAMVYPDAGQGIFAGRGAVLHLSPGPDIVELPRAALFAVSGSGASNAAGGSRGAVWALLRNALDEARSFRVAPPSNAPRDDALNALDIAAIGPVLSRQIPLVISAQREADIRQAAALAEDYNIRIVILGGAEAWRVRDLLSRQKIPVILDPLDDLPMSYDMVGARRDNATLLHKAGVTIAFSVSGQGIYLSYNVGPALREGAGLAVANGLPYHAALRAITTGPAALWGPSSEATGVSGSGLKAGAKADLVIWDGDPLEVSSAPVHVIISGQDISLQTRQKQLRDRYHPSRQNRVLSQGYP